MPEVKSIKKSMFEKDIPAEIMAQFVDFLNLRPRHRSSE